ncbi:sorting nexin Snx41 [Schizosaccharomyces cryophilus OY26]|uniref:Sorting nexin Snx41 n=1 Tax=Schizosaccharomyces cryophilus (strain OY26 / ATCC MYA-4695 / CBS 11777 / NBRC 106824 / NRRL Y48691) TaxID=653667 RepID=S9VR24_SCHCR|nr:sorting nexin Snx41 [Schizosaccharomyces cryophilus OY26]EPY50383.1 sorting nexin Snx41 [Schizosaccharomyces cryophilus OY26]
MDFFEDNNPFGDQSPSRLSESNKHPEGQLAFATERNQKENDGNRDWNLNVSLEEKERKISFLKDFKIEEDDLPNAIFITGAVKAERGAHVVYNIKVNNSEVQRRYSEFASLRVQFERLYPTCLVPVLPDKHKVMDYVFNITKSQRTIRLLEERKRLLQSFLRRVAVHPKLGKSEIFYKFLSRRVSWNDVLQSAPISLLPKDLLKVNPENPASNENVDAYLKLPVPSKTSLPVEFYDEESQNYLLLEDSLKRYSINLQEHLSRFNRGVFSISQMSLAYSNLGATFNALSLSESGGLMTVLESVGQANDHTCLSGIDFIHGMVVDVIEPLSEISKSAKSMRHIIIFRRMKFIQNVLVNDLLRRKKGLLKLLERREQQASRLQQAIHENSEVLDAETRDFLEPSNADPHLAYSSGQQQDFINNRDQPLLSENNGSFAQTLENEHEVDEQVDSERIQEYARELANTHHQQDDATSLETSVSSALLPRTVRDVFDQIRYAFNGLTDNNVETKRHNSMGRTLESVHHLEKMAELTSKGLDFVTTSVGSEYERYKIIHQEDMSRVCNKIADRHIEWAERNIRAWKNIRQDLFSNLL